jgi:hypothetical protein
MLEIGVFLMENTHSNFEFRWLINWYGDNMRKNIVCMQAENKTTEQNFDQRAQFLRPTFFFS